MIKQRFAQVSLGLLLLSAGTSHLTSGRLAFQAQVPTWLPLDPDFVVLASGVVEILLGVALLLLWRARAQVGLVVALFFVAIFPGNINQFVERIDAFGLNTDMARGVRLLFQPVLVLWALWAPGWVIGVPLMPAKPIRRSALLALALLMAAAVPVRATTPPTFTVVDSIYPGGDDSFAMDLSETTALGGYLYFTATDATSGRELWRTNGSTTELVTDINAGADHSEPDGFTALGGYLYFAASDAFSGRELWRTNGSTTELVGDIATGGYDSDPYDLTAFGDHLYFRADDGVTGYELWRTNGTTTSLVQDISPGKDGSSPRYFTAVGDYLYFQTYEGNNRFVYRTDGVVTQRVPFPIDADQYVICGWCFATTSLPWGVASLASCTQRLLDGSLRI